MKEKEKLIFEMENLIEVLKDCLQVLEEGESMEQLISGWGKVYFLYYGKYGTI